MIVVWQFNTSVFATNIHNKGFCFTQPNPKTLYYERFASLGYSVFVVYYY